MTLSVDYHSRPEISRSMLMDFRRSRRLYHARYVARTIEPEPETPAMKIGTLTHCAILQGAELDSIMAVIPSHLLSADGGIRTKEARDWKSAAEASGLIVVKDDEKTSTLKPIIDMRDAILRSDAGRWLTRPDAVAETPVMWSDSETGLQLRALHDFRLDLGAEWLSTDIKTCVDIKKFPKVVAESYWMQHAHYEAALQSLDEKPVMFTFLAVEKSPPYLVRCYQMSDSMAGRARTLWRETLQQLAECYASGDWSDPGEDEVQLVDREIFQ